MGPFRKIVVASKEVSRVAKNLTGRAAGYGYCLECGDTWDWKSYHCTTYEEGRGCFALCDECWDMADRHGVLSAYSRMIREWRSTGSWYPPEKGAIILSAALREKGWPIVTRAETEIYLG